MDKKTLYLECYSGISGDMTVASLIDLGADVDVLMAGLNSLNVDGYKIEISRKEKNSIDACDFHVVLEVPETDYMVEEAHSHEHLHENNIPHEHNISNENHVLHEHDTDSKHDIGHSHEQDGHFYKQDDGHFHEHNDGHFHKQDDEHFHKQDDGHFHEQDDGHFHEHDDGHFHEHDGYFHHHDDNHGQSHKQDESHHHKTGQAQSLGSQKELTSPQGGHHHIHRHVPAPLKKVTSLHTHSHSHDESKPHLHYGHHEHRNLNDINLIIDGSDISMNAKDIAKRIFYIVAAAEAKAHGKPVDEVHFHEVGAVDSIVDIVATAICLDNLNIGEVIVSELYEGTGHINCQHGVLPVPVPAVVNIAASHHLKLHITSVKGELVTPTGAAIVAAIKTSDTLPKEFKINRIGLGAGKRNYERTSFLRAMLIEEIKGTVSSTVVPDSVWVLEANIDDCTGEALSIAMDTLLKNGAKDVYYSPIFMKKNRPAYLLGVICSEDKIELMEELIFIHTTTIGIRKHEAYRTTLNREIKTINTPFGEALVKVCSYKDNTYYYPECESVKKLCVESGKDYGTLYSLIQTLAVQQKISE